MAAVSTREVPLAALLQIFHRRRITCALGLRVEGALVGSIELSEGRVESASFGELRGESALAALVRAGELSCEVDERASRSDAMALATLSALYRAAHEAREGERVDRPSVSASTTLVPPRPTGGSGRWALLLLALAACLTLVVWHAQRRSSGPATPPRISALALRPASAPDAGPARSTGEPTPPAPIELRHLVVKGSDTMGRTLVPAWAYALEAQQPGLRVHVQALGSSTGFAGLFDGTAQVAASSRAIRPEERKVAEQVGVKLHEILVAHDAIAVIVHPESRVTALDMATLARAFSGQLRSLTELGDIALAPHLIGRPSYSGTHAFFREQVLTPLGAGTGFAANLTDIEGSLAIAAAVQADRAALAYVSFGYAMQGVKVLALSRRAGEVEKLPSDESVRDGSYPLSRPLFLYVRHDAGADARALLALALSEQGQAIVGAQGFTPLGPSERAALPELAPEVPRGAVVRVYFEPASTQLDPASAAMLVHAAAQLKQGARAVIIGNADPGGAEASNARIATRRAESVAARLTALGVDPSRMEVETAASEHPLASNNTSSGRRENRRVDVIVTRAAPHAP